MNKIRWLAAPMPACFSLLSNLSFSFVFFRNLYQDCKHSIVSLTKCIWNISWFNEFPGSKHTDTICVVFYFIFSSLVLGQIDLIPYRHHWHFSLSRYFQNICTRTSRPITFSGFDYLLSMWGHASWEQDWDLNKAPKKKNLKNFVFICFATTKFLWKWNALKLYWFNIYSDEWQFYWHIDGIKYKSVGKTHVIL